MGAEKTEMQAMQVDEALEHADEWIKGVTLYEGAQGWRVACATLAAEVRHLRDLLAAAKWPEAPDDRRLAQAEGKHPAPCARFCEANAFEIELRSLRKRIDSAPVAIMDTRDVLGVCAPTEEDFPALYALQGHRVALVDMGPNARNHGLPIGSPVD